MSDPCPGCTVLAQSVPPRPPYDPRPIPEEEHHVEPLPGPACEPPVVEKKALAQMVFPLLPQTLRDEYVRVGKERNKTAVEALAWDLGATHENGGLNSREQRISVYSREAGRAISQTDWEHITRAEAYRFIAGYREFRGNGFGVPHTPLASALATIPAGKDRSIIESIFFPHAPLAGAVRRRILGENYLPAVIVGVSDGDTVKVRVIRNGCDIEETSIRFAGIDTPEKFRSEAKFWPQHEALMHLLKDQGLVRENEISRDSPLGALLANRMEYAGAISSLVMKDFLSFALAHGGKFFLEETFDRVQRPNDAKEKCDEAALYDVYLRSIWVLRVEPPALMTEYMEKHLGDVMGGNGATLTYKFGNETVQTENGPALWQSYQIDALIAKAKSPGERQRLQAAKRQLDQWRQEGRGALADLLDPAKIPTTQALFSQAATQQMAATWKGFIATHPDRAGDINLAMVGMGAAYAYTKYLNDLSADYLALGNTIKKAGLGLWGEELVRTMDPNVLILNKETRRFEPYTMPKDCTNS